MFVEPAATRIGVAGSRATWPFSVLTTMIPAVVPVRCATSEAHTSASGLLRQPWAGVGSPSTFARTVAVFTYAPDGTVPVATYSQVSPGSSTPLRLVSPTTNPVGDITGETSNGMQDAQPPPLSDSSHTSRAVLPLLVTRYDQVTALPAVRITPGAYWASSSAVGCSGSTALTAFCTVIALIAPKWSLTSVDVAVVPRCGSVTVTVADDTNWPATTA